ncbi:MAG: DNA/RNA non-specific endonuclease [Candidatus Kapabacteria bacterium]|nr:DNA/RNA non-specific endonuclease [Candidatus Kapabacteria bacterium]
MKKIFLIFILSVLPVFSQIEIPKGANDCEFIKHTYFSLCYDEEHEQARWVAYILTKEMIVGESVYRKEYKPDKKVSTESAKDSDYLNSNFSRGHLAPAADFKFSQLGIEESYLYSNISPQLQDGFNESGGVWNNLEQRVREWVCKEDTVYIVTGPVLDNKLIKRKLPKIPDSKVSIPKEFFKAILVYSQKSVKAIAFVVPNSSSKDDIFKYSLSIDRLEKLIGYDLFSELPDDIEKSIEIDFDTNAWHQNPRPYVRKKPSPPCTIKSNR